MNPLILVNNENNEYFEDATHSGFYYIFKSENMINRVYRKIILNTRSAFRKDLFTHWKKRLMSVIQLFCLIQEMQLQF